LRYPRVETCSVNCAACVRTTSSPTHGLARTATETVFTLVDSSSALQLPRHSRSRDGPHRSLLQLFRQHVERNLNLVSAFHFTKPSFKQGALQCVQSIYN